ncbi:c-type cytochrome [Leucothrix sargassi]|nr:c-type cytochrome [Leucothrix sargassi]
MHVAKKDVSQPIKGRWYINEQLKLGKQVFTDNCAACHSNNARAYLTGQLFSCATSDL